MAMTRLLQRLRRRSYFSREPLTMAREEMQNQGQKKVKRTTMTRMMMKTRTPEMKTRRGNFPAVMTTMT